MRLSLYKKLKHTSIQNRFLIKVLAPPFVILLLVSLACFWQLDRAVRSAAVNDLRQGASTTATKLERELGLRKTILLTTGNELFMTKSEYVTKRSQLETQRNECKAYVIKAKEYLKAPNGVCEPFLVQFAAVSGNPASLPQAIEDAYVVAAPALHTQEQAKIKDRLDAFVEYFPETRALVVADKQGRVVSQAVNETLGTKLKAEDLVSEASKKGEESQKGYVRTESGQRLAVFAFPINEGMVLSAFDIDHLSFLHPSWNSTPIDTTKAYAVIVDPTAQASYPKLDDNTLYQSALNGGLATFTDKNISYLAVSEIVGTTDWRVVVGSPRAVVLAPLRDAQVAAVAIIGVLLVSFLWVGALFVQRTIRSILGLVAGAVVFSAGQLDYKIQLDNADDEFSRLATTMNDMAGRIQAAEKELNQKNKEFISIATHELKAPMTATIGNLSMVLEDGIGQVDDTARKLIDESYKGTIRLRNLVSEMLDIARLESGRAQFDIQPLDLATEAREIIAMQKTPAAEKNIEVSHITPNDLPQVLADKTKLEIILTNFISNAIKYNRQSGHVSVSHIVQGNTVQTAVQDNGLGIPEEQKAKMFQKFFRVEGDDRKDIPGTGLGMYITKQFIEAMGGKLWFDSITGQGTTFYFTLPIVQMAPQTQPAVGSPAVVVSQPVVTEAGQVPAPQVSPNVVNQPNDKPLIVDGS